MHVACMAQFSFSYSICHSNSSFNSVEEHWTWTNAEFQEQGRSLHPRAFFGIVSLRVRLIWSLLISGWLWNLKDFTKYRTHSENIKKPPVIFLKKNYPVKSWFMNPTSSRLRRWRWYFGLGLRLRLGLLITVWRHGWEYVYRLSIICMCVSVNIYIYIY